MTKTKEYGAIDYFRMVAALLVVGIHTSPFIQVSDMTDFIFTRIIARIAVPFFIMATGFFMNKDAMISKERLKSFITKTLKLYMIGIIIYLPINIYMGYFKQENVLLNIVKDILWNGTMYHLWYLPAIVLGTIISYYLVNKIGKRWALCIAVLLYFIGLFGDSYYGISVLNESFKIFYTYIFELFDYTRNGIFFVPIFFILGIIIKDQEEKIPASMVTSFLGLLISITLLIAEGMILHNYQVQRHDSMYILLLPTMYFLFHVLIRIKGPGNRVLRDLSMIVYLIHPLMIVVIRLVAKIINMETILIHNNFIHFIIVTIGSCIFGFIVLRIRNKVVINKP